MPVPRTPPMSEAKRAELEDLRLQERYKSGRVYISALATAIDRSVHTIRTWAFKGVLPPHLQGHRDARGWRYWTPSQVDEIARWVEGRRYQSDEKLQKMRAPRK